jgi:hypothetical protein
MEHRKRRLILSCVPCRRRKVKCDRAVPCLRCQKAGYAETCIYSLPDESYLPSGTEDRGGGKSDAGQTRRICQEEVFEIESYVKSAGARPFSSEKFLGLAHPAGPGASIQSNGRSLQDIKQTFNSQYFGPSHAAGLLLQCEELSAFVRKVLSHGPASHRRREEIRSSAEKQVAKRARLGEALNKEKLISLMPPRLRADCLIQTYLNMFENTYRVLHVPSFLQRYEGFWAVPMMSADITIVHILLAMAAVNAFVPGGEDSFVGRSSTAREKAKLWIRAAESWLSVQSHKNYTLETLQMHVLLFHAKKMNCMEKKRGWTCIGTLVRMMIAAGMHREPTHLCRNISFFEAEIRRRLWYTVLELELQEACDRGMQPMLNGETWDCLPPLNIHDEDFDEMTMSVPCERPLDTYTRTSFLHAGQKHLLLRLDVLAKSNSVRNLIDLAMAKNYVELLQESIDELPSWSEEPTSAVARTLSKLILYEQLLILQQPFTTLQANPHRCTLYFRTIQRQTAIFIMESYRTLPRLEGLQLFNFRGDGFHAVLAMSREAVRSADPMDDLLHNKEAEIGLIDHTVKLLDNRVRCLGQGFQLYWLASAALRLIKSRYSRALDEDLLAVETAESAFRLLDYMNQRSIPDAGRTLGDSGFSATDVAQVQEQIRSNSRTFQNLDIFSNLGDFGPSDDWLLGCDLGDIWNWGGLPGEVQI